LRHTFVWQPNYDVRDYNMRHCIGQSAQLLLQYSSQNECHKLSF